MPFEPFIPPPGHSAHQSTAEYALRTMPPQVPSGDQHYFAPDAPYQAARKVWWMHTAVIGLIGAKAGKNHFAVTGDWGQSIQAAAGAFARWMVWSTLWFVWAALLMWFATPTEAGFTGNDIAGLAASLVIWPFAFGVTWCRNIDYSLFKRRLIYKLYQPIAVALEGVPSPLLYALMCVPLAVLWGSF